MSKKNFDKNRNSREREVKEFDEEVLEIDRVTRVVKGGRRMRFRCLVAIGDRKGRVAIGIGKASEVVNGIKKAITQAKKSLFRVPINEHDSIPHEVHYKYKAAKIMIRPALPGTGVIAGGSLRKILRLAGVKNILSKQFGTNNKVVTAQAAMLALRKLKPAKKVKVAEAKAAPTPQGSSDFKKSDKPNKMVRRGGKPMPPSAPKKAEKAVAPSAPAVEDVSATPTTPSVPETPSETTK